MILSCKNGGRNLLMLCLVAVAAVLVSSCRSPASDADRCQWSIVAHANGSDSVYVIDRDTGDVAVWNKREKKWAPACSCMNPGALPDWDAIRNQREVHQKALEKCEAFAKSFHQLPLEKQVAWAKEISICKFMGNRFVARQLDMERDSGCLAVPLMFYHLPLSPVETLKMEWGSRGKSRVPYESTDTNLVVRFMGTVDGIDLGFGLTPTLVDSKYFLVSSKTIIDDVKAEVKRQEEKKEDHAENH